MTYTSHRGYGTAASIDSILNQIIRENPITKEENITGYEALIRTLESSLAIMRDKLEETRQQTNICPTCQRPLGEN